MEVGRHRHVDMYTTLCPCTRTHARTALLSSVCLSVCGVGVSVLELRGTEQPGASNRIRSPRWVGTHSAPVSCRPNFLDSFTIQKTKLSQHTSLARAREGEVRFRRIPSSSLCTPENNINTNMLLLGEGTVKEGKRPSHARVSPSPSLCTSRPVLHSQHNTTQHRYTPCRGLFA